MKLFRIRALLHGWMFPVKQLLQTTFPSTMVLQRPTIKIAAHPRTSFPLSFLTLLPIAGGHHFAHSTQMTRTRAAAAASDPFDFPKKRSLFRFNNLAPLDFAAICVNGRCYRAQGDSSLPHLSKLGDSGSGCVDKTRK